MLIRPIHMERDFDAVYLLNQQSFVEYWSAEGLLAALKGGMDCFVLEQSGQIVAYVLSQDLLDWVEVMQLAVAVDFRRLGLAIALMQYLIAQKKHFSSITLEVRDSNLAAQCLYQQLGFRETGRRKDYYQPPPGISKYEDAVIMELFKASSD